MVDNILSKLSHHQSTDLKEGKINNQDAALLLIGSRIIAKSGVIKNELRAWRKEPRSFTYLFNTSEYGGYGYVGKDLDSRSNPVYMGGDRKDVQRKTYWYRVKNGLYTPTFLGWGRYAEIIRFFS